MILIETIQADLLAARKAKNEPVKNLLTALLGEATAIGKNNGNRLTTDDEVISLTKKFIKSAEETRKILEDNNRDTYEVNAEVIYLERYVPMQMSELEIEKAAGTHARDTENANMATFMKFMKENHAGKYDGKLASQVAKRVFV